MRRIKGYAFHKRSLLSALSGKTRLHGLPEDAEFVNEFFDNYTEDTILVVYSETFDEVPEGATLPIVTADLRRNDL